MSNKKTVEVDVEVLRETMSAILVSDGGKQEVWIAKSQIIDGDPEVGKHVTITIPEWIAREKGLV